MTCPSGEIWTAYADDESPRAEMPELEAHLARCPDCRSLVLALREENRVLVRVLDEVPDAGKQRSALPGVALAVGTLVAVAAGLQVASNGLAGLGRESPVDLADERTLILGALFEIVLYVLREGASMLESMVAAVVLPILIVLGGLVALSLRRRWAGGALALCALLAAAAPSVALEVRGSRSERDRVVVGAGEIVDDSLAVAGHVVAVDGTVTGNLFAAGGRVILRGTVKGDLVAVGERVEIEGTVEGNVFTIGGTVLVRGSIGRSAHCAAADTIRVDPAGRVDGDTVGFAGTIDLDGHVGRDLVAFAGTTNVRGDVGRNASVRTRRLHLEPAAKVGGNLVARVRDAHAVQVDEGAIVSGKTEKRLLPKERSRYARVGFYGWRLIWLAAAFLVGLALHALVPGLFPARVPEGVALLRTAGLGFVALVVVPAAALLLMLTLIGLPAGLLMLGVWLAGLYVAQILVATLVGRGFLQKADAPPASIASALLVGLVFVAIVVNLPYVGGPVRFVVLVLGLGLAVVGAQRGGTARP